MNNNNLPPVNRDNNILKIIVSGILTFGGWVFTGVGIILTTIFLLLFQDAIAQTPMGPDPNGYDLMYRNMPTPDLLSEKRKLEIDLLNIRRAENESRARGMFYQSQNPGVFSSWYMINKGINRRNETQNLINEISYHNNLIDNELSARRNN